MAAQQRVTTLYMLLRALSGKRRINFVRGGSRHFGTQRSCRSLAANSTLRGGGLDLVSPKSRKTITKLGRTKCLLALPSLARPIALSLTPFRHLPCLLYRGNFLRRTSGAAGNCSERNRYIADFKVGQRGSPYFFTGPFAAVGYCGVAAVVFHASLLSRHDDYDDRQQP